MADFDYSSLSPEQTKIALKVVDAAKKYGLNPDLIVPLIMAESGMSHIPSERLDKNGKPISNGVMQLTPGTAAQYGVKDYMSGDVDANINAGMNFLSDLSKNSAIGNNPRKLIAGYNAGPGSTYVKTGDEADLLPETKKHIENISKYSQGNSLASTENSSSSQQDPDSFFKEPVAQEVSSEDRSAHDDFFGTEKPKEVTADKLAEPRGSMHEALGGMLVGGSLSGVSHGVGALLDRYAPARAVVPEGGGGSPVETPPLNAENAKINTSAPTGYSPEKAVGPGQAIDNYTQSLQKLTPTAQTITAQEAANILSPAEAQAKLAENVPKIRAVQKVAPSARIVSPTTGLIANTVPWTNPATGETHNVPALTVKNPKTGRTSIVADPVYVKSIEAVAAQKEAERASAIETQKIENNKAASSSKEAADLAAKEAYQKSILGRTLGFAGNTLRGGLSGMGALYGYETARDALKNNQYAQSGLHALSGLASGADLAASIPAIAKTGMRTVAAPLAIAADTGANLVKHYQAGEYDKMPADVGVGALAAIPYVGVPLSLSASYLRDHPEIIEKLSSQANPQRALANVDAMGNPY